MKKLLMIAAVLGLFSCNSFGQKGKNVPEVVKNAFAQKFPQATGVKWDKENDKEWEAEFKINGKEASANYDMNGTWLETEYEISMKEVPTAVKNTLDKDFAGYKIKESEISETAKGKLYEFEIQKDDNKLEVGIDESGVIVKKEVEKKGKDGEDKDND